MFGLARNKLVAVVAAAALALSPVATLAHPGGGFHGGGFHGGGFPAGGFHGGGFPAGGFHGGGFHGGGSPHWQGPPPNWHNGPHGGPRGPGPVRQPWNGGPQPYWHGGPPPHWHGGPPPYWHGAPPPYWHGGPYYGPAALGPNWYGPPYGPYGPGWGWNGGAWVPFAAGALIGGGVIAATNNDNTVNTATTPTINPKHYQWCEDHYKSYRVSDNTYQPYNGPRQQCVSPYY